MAKQTIAMGQIINSGVEVYGDVRPKKKGMEDNAPQAVRDDGSLGWTVTVLRKNDRLVEEQRITVWSPAEPQVKDQDIVTFSDVEVGAYANSGRAGLYIHSSGVQPADSMADFD